MERVCTFRALKTSLNLLPDILKLPFIVVELYKLAFTLFKVVKHTLSMCIELFPSFVPVIILSISSADS